MSCCCMILTVEVTGYNGDTTYSSVCLEESRYPAYTHVSRLDFVPFKIRETPSFPPDFLSKVCPLSISFL